MKMETKESAQAKIKALRTELAKDKAEKIADGRKSGQGLSARETDNGTGETRAGGDKVVRVWDVPEEFEAVDYTLAEYDMREKVKGPDLRWLLSGRTVATCCPRRTASRLPRRRRTTF